MITEQFSFNFWMWKFILTFTDSVSNINMRINLKRAYNFSNLCDLSIFFRTCQRCQCHRSNRPWRNIYVPFSLSWRVSNTRKLRKSWSNSWSLRVPVWINIYSRNVNLRIIGWVHRRLKHYFQFPYCLNTHLNCMCETECAKEKQMNIQFYS